MRTLIRLKPNLMYILCCLFFWLTSCQKDSDLYQQLQLLEEEQVIENVLGDEEESTDSSNKEEISEDNNDETDIDSFYSLENAYFVTTNGSASNDGRSEQTSWSWSHAVANAQPGMTIFVKAGNYGGGNYTFNQNGSLGNEIKFVGYKTTPGDINPYQQTLKSDETRDRRGTTRYANNREYDYTMTPSTTEMPYFNKSYSPDDIFFTVRGNHIEFHNIIIKGGDFGILYAQGSSENKLINSIIMEQGRMDIASTNTSHPDRYHGFGVANRQSENLEVRFCSFLNCEQEAVQIRGANSGTYADNVVYSYNAINGTDYFYLVTSQSGNPSRDLTIEYNRCHRLEGTRHGGHGFITKNGAVNNTFRNWKVINTNIETSFANATGNLFEKGELNGTFLDNGDPLAYLLTSNGSTGNTFKDIVIDNVWGGLVFLDHGEDRSSPYAGRANDYINIIVKNARYGVIFSESSSNLGPTNDNRFLNCTFYNTQYGIRAYRNNSGNSFINCHFSASGSLNTNHAGFSLNRNTKFENCHFSGNLNRNSALPFDEKDIIDGNPQFLNPNAITNGSFDVMGLQLLPSSPLLGAGQNTSQYNSKSGEDFSGKNRTSYNIGAF